LEGGSSLPPELADSDPEDDSPPLLGLSPDPEAPEDEPDPFLPDDEDDFEDEDDSSSELDEDEELSLELERELRELFELLELEDDEELSLSDRDEDEYELLA
jgi:hypothetical protein